MRACFALLIIALLYSCSPVSKGRLTRSLKATEDRFQDHTGFVLYDLGKNKTIFDYNGSRYFTPASNTKIFTLYSALKILGDSVPGLEYIQRNDSLIFWGTGDPSFLYREVHYDSTVYHFLKTADADLYFSTSNFQTKHFGEGWAWDDYNSAYSSERSPFPIYGNTVSVVADREVLRVTPDYFLRFLKKGSPKEDREVIRAPETNSFVFHPSGSLTDISVKEFKVPFRADSATVYALMADTLKRFVHATNKPLPPYANTIFSIHIDSLFSVMMKESDNFIAEQLLMMCANVLSDTLKPEIAIAFMKKNYLKDLPDEPVWVDGSGLSRYNLFTPRSIVKLWHKIWEEVPRERLFALLATGGVDGTIKKWYYADKPYIFGKTGTLSNNHCMSGFLLTKKGKVLIFSFMNSNYTTGTNAIRRNMQGILEDIREHY